MIQWAHAEKDETQSARLSVKYDIPSNRQSAHNWRLYIYRDQKYKRDSHLSLRAAQNEWNSLDAPSPLNISNSVSFLIRFCVRFLPLRFWSAHFATHCCHVQNSLCGVSIGPEKRRKRERCAGVNKPISSAIEQTAGAAFPVQNHNMKYISAPLAIKKRQQQHALPSGALSDATAVAGRVL